MGTMNLFSSRSPVLLIYQASVYLLLRFQVDFDPIRGFGETDALVKHMKHIFSVMQVSGYALLPSIYNAVEGFQAGKIYCHC
jgi:hypothetical protein